MNTFLFWATTLWMIVLLGLGVLAVRHVVRERGRPDHEAEPDPAKARPSPGSSPGTTGEAPP